MSVHSTKIWSMHCDRQTEQAFAHLCPRRTRCVSRKFRGSLIKALLAAGYRVIAGAGDSDPNTSQVLKAWVYRLRRYHLLARE